MEESPSSLSDAPGPIMGLSLSRGGVASSSAMKRAAPSSFDGHEEESSKKRFKEDLGNEPDNDKPVAKLNYEAFADDLTQELQCGCCAELVYQPVIVSPCQHFFCGRYDSFGALSYTTADIRFSCCVLWIRVSFVVSNSSWHTMRHSADPFGIKASMPTCFHSSLSLASHPRSY